MAGVAGKVLAHLRELIAQAIAPHRFHATIRYRVESQSGERLRLQIVKLHTGFPDILPIDLMPGVPGCSADVALGSEVLVTFVEGDPTLPVVTHFQRPGGPGFVPVALRLDASTLVRIGESAAMVELGSGSVGSPGVVDPIGRLVRWGDVAYIGGADTPLVPGGTSGIPPYQNIAKVKA